MDVVSDRAREDLSGLMAATPEVPARDSTPNRDAVGGAVGPVHEVLSFREVYDRFFAFVWRSAANRGVPRSALADVVQEVFIVVARKLPEQTASTGALPLEALEQKAAVQLLDTLLSKMSEEQREAFVLHELEHMSGIEIAEITGVNENTVWSRLRAARKIFQEGVAREKARGSREQA